MDYNAEALKAHKAHRGKVEVVSKMDVGDKDALSIAYTPGVAEPCRRIAENKEDVYTYTAKGNLVAILTDGSAVLGLGNIGPEAAMPVMEGKAILFKEFGNVDAFPICVDTQDVDEIVQTAINIAPTFGGINLEDIAAPRCFEIEERLQAALDIPIFHDDQHGTAIVVASGLINAMKVVDKAMDQVRVVISGAGSAGTAIAKMLLAVGFVDIVMVDRDGVLYKGKSGMPAHMAWLAEHTNPQGITGGLAEAMAGADAFVGVSAPNIVSQKMVRSMAEDAIVFAMANPVPEIMPEDAQAAGARIIGTGRSDYPNQINNLLAFPGLFRGALDARAKRITQGMKVAAANAIANLVSEEERCDICIIPSPFDKRVGPAVTKAVYDAWMAEDDAQ
ncbi:MAG: NADP-dependent malic enzyme [Eubacterium aggregans]|uniref:NAD(P)-dependent malic enzyme n=1 Tax=Eubacterium aggregans TaxID=81409 RepID=UPI002B1F1680|nr:NADP-dependent malic enzyme [Eubacterium aggregans]MEA5072791.1 NADP-dependent malic enzyme [Eubacterium aggregans]